jgi:hypothetical protein
MLRPGKELTTLVPLDTLITTLSAVLVLLKDA